MSKILYVIENEKSWINYAPALVKLAREHNASVQVLDISAPLGAGTFTSASVWEPHNPDLEKNDFTNAPVPGDTKAAVAAESTIRDEIVAYLKSARIEAEAHWKPDMPFEEIAPYAKSVGADILAHAKLGTIEGWFRRGEKTSLESDGFKLAFLESSV
jgi:hypothetical protein